MKVQIGKNTLGGGKKMSVTTRSYERSSHNLSSIFRSSMASGTLVPFMKIPLLTADTIDIDLSCEVLTHPTIGPLFGSYKVQLDVFKADVRLYQGKLHNNALNIGLNMANIRLPRIQMYAEDVDFSKPVDNQQMNASCIFKYLGISGIGRTSGGIERFRYFNAIPFLAYWDIYKNYYANKQEVNGAMIHNTDIVQSITSFDLASNGNAAILPKVPATAISFEMLADGFVNLIYTGTAPDPNTVEILYTIDIMGVPVQRVNTVSEMFNTITPTSGALTCTSLKNEYWGAKFNQYNYVGVTNRPASILRFPLTNIDTMREDILAATKNTTAFTINQNSLAPYGTPLKKEGNIRSMLTSQEGLGLKTYQSDVFNNWIRTEFINGAGSINAITAISTAGGSFTIDTLTLARRVYNMLNAIAISGGSYDDWLDVNWDETRYQRAETPEYQGGLIKELVFQEVISNSASIADGGQPLGTLAGRGVLSNKHKGGKIRVKATEIGYLMGIVSITPRIDYSQGNDWDVNLQTMDDFHKPALDQIGYQDLITDQMAYWDTVTGASGAVTFLSAGKQPAWINYMTNYNRVFGSFAEQDNQMFMTLNRRYEANADPKGIKDLTTYIDPAKYNHIFAYTARDAQNFWVQIGMEIVARRKMSAKIMPQG